MADPTLIVSSDDESLSDTLPSEDLTADKHLRGVPRMRHLNREMPALDGIPLFRQLGKGGMGAVYYGVHLRLQREVAVKVLTLSDSSQDAIKRFDREARIGAKISEKSAHLVKVHDVKESHGLHYMVMEFVRGGSAANVLKEAQEANIRVPELAALDLCIAATEGLCAAHEEGIIHRDIKPANILVPRPNYGAWQYSSAKLADLGLARFESSGKSLTGDGAGMGTPGYMAPEQALNARRARKPADVFSMGATLYALLGGCAPFTGITFSEILIKTIQDPHTPIIELRPDVSPVTRTLIDQCLAKDPNQRFTDAFALRDALNVCRKVVDQAPDSQMQAASELTVLRRRTETGKPVPDTTPTRVTGTVSTQQDAPSTPATFFASRWFAPAIALIVVGSSIYGIYFSHRGNATKQNTAEPPALSTAQTNSSEPALAAKTTLPALAKALGEKLNAKGVKKVAVLEFLDDSGDERRLGGPIGAAGKQFASDAEVALDNVDNKKYGLVERAQLEAVLKEIRFQAGDLAKPESLKRLNAKIAPVDTIIVGAVRRVRGSAIVALKALAIPDGSVVASVTGVLPLDSDLVALFGESYCIVPEPLKEPREAQVVALVSSGDLQHPYVDKASEPQYRVEIFEEGLPLPFYRNRKDIYVPADSGKKYTIRLTNKSEDKVAVALLIDGLNSIDQVRAPAGAARKWVLEAGRAVEIKGWQMGLEKAREFMFTDGAESLAARQNFCDDIGLITAAFYRERKKRGLGTGEGNEIGSKVKEVQFDREDCPVAVIGIHYDRADEVRKMERVK